MNKLTTALFLKLASFPEWIFSAKSVKQRDSKISKTKYIYLYLNTYEEHCPERLCFIFEVESNRLLNTAWYKKILSPHPSLTKLIHEYEFKNEKPNIFLHELIRTPSTDRILNYKMNLKKLSSLINTKKVVLHYVYFYFKNDKNQHNTFSFGSNVKMFRKIGCIRTMRNEANNITNVNIIDIRS